MNDITCPNCNSNNAGACTIHEKTRLVTFNCHECGESTEFKLVD